MTVRIGVIGCGGIAGNHISGYKANGASITALMDITAEAANKRKAEDAPEAKVFESTEALLESGIVDAVSVCTGRGHHRDHRHT